MFYTIAYPILSSWTHCYCDWTHCCFQCSIQWHNPGKFLLYSNYLFFLFFFLKDRANEIYKKVEDLKSIRGRNQDAILAACLYIACRQEDRPRTVKGTYCSAQFWIFWTFGFITIHAFNSIFLFCVVLYCCRNMFCC